MARVCSVLFESGSPVMCSSIVMSSKKNKASRRNVKSSSKTVNWGCSDSCSPQTLKLLQEWLFAKGLPTQKLALEPVRAGGRGLVAKTNIRNGEKLLYVPFNMVITTDSEWTTPACDEILSAEGVPDWPFLATYLISEACCGADSPWFPYIAALPQEPESVLLWSEEEVRKYLKASSVFDQALERLSEVENVYQDMWSSVYSKHLHLFPEKFFTMESFKWAFGILFSRLVRLQSLNDEVALVPWADMLNHSSQVDACLDFDSSSNTIILTTDRSYQPSDQVFISYGEKSKGELLLSYGFVTSDINEIDSVDLTFALDNNDEMHTAKEAALRECGVSSPYKYPLTIRGISSQLFAFAYLAVCPLSMSSYIPQLASAAVPKKATQDNFRSEIFNFAIDVDISAHELILRIVETSLLKISKFLEENQSMVVDQNGDQMGIGKESIKLSMACTLCSSEQRILYRVQHVLRSKLRELRARKAFGRDSLPAVLSGLGKLF